MVCMLAIPLSTVSGEGAPASHRGRKRPQLMVGSLARYRLLLLVAVDADLHPMPELRRERINYG